MSEILSTISEMSYVSLCCEMSTAGDGVLDFRFKHSFHGERIEPMFRILERDERIIITDKGSTFTNLNEYFRLDESVIIETISKILAQFNMEAYSRSMGTDYMPREVVNYFARYLGGCLPYECFVTEVVYEIDINKRFRTQFWEYMQGINFLYTMKLFYK